MLPWDIFSGDKLIFELFEDQRHPGNTYVLSLYVPIPGYSDAKRAETAENTERADVISSSETVILGSPQKQVKQALSV